MERLVRRRSSLKAWATRYTNEVDEVVANENLPRLQEIVLLLEEKIQSIRALDDQIADLVDESDVEQETSAAEEYLDGLKVVLLKVKRHLKIPLTLNIGTINGGSVAGSVRENVLELEQTGNNGGSARDDKDESLNNAVSSDSILKLPSEVKNDKETAVVCGKTGRGHFQLPKLNIPKFGGDVSKWQGFFDAFSSAIDTNPVLSCVEKFTYLRSYLEGQAAASVAGISLSDANYGLALKILKERFGRQEIIISTYMQRLLNVSPVRKASDITNLRNAFDTVETLVRSLESLGVTTNTYGNMLCPIILKIIPEEMVILYNRMVEDEDIFDVEKLLAFWKKEVQGRERSSQLSSKEKSSKVEKECETDDEGLARMTAAALTMTTKKVLKCVFCSENHFTHRCTKAIEPEKRKTLVMKEKACFLCLRKGHAVKECTLKHLKCSKCGGKHNTMICTKTSEGEVKTVNVGLKMASPSVLLQVIKAKAVFKGKEIEVRCMLDCGSDRTFVKQSVVKALGLEPVSKEKLSIQGFGGVTKSKEFSNFQLQIRGLRKKEVLAMQALGSESICQIRSVSMSLSTLQKIRDSNVDIDVENLNGAIDVLIGSDYYWTLVTGEIKRFSDSLVAVNTKLGWLLTGPVEDESNPLICMLNVEQWPVEDMWKLESIGLHDEKDVDTTHNYLQKLKINRLSDGRYEVGLLWKNGSRPTPNYEQAKMRALSQLKRLTRCNLVNEYEKIIHEQLDEGIIEEASENGRFDLYYMPHKAVVNEQKTTKVRMVFDASAGMAGGKSLNDCLDTGPNMIKDFLKIVLKFRTYRVGVVADIKKAYHQIAVKDEDSVYQNFLWFCNWRQGQELKVFGFRRVVFGISCSPFALNATIQYHLQNTSDFKQRKRVSESLYMDDLVCGADTIADAMSLCTDSERCLLTAGMVLHKWASNSKELSDYLKKHNNVADNESEQNVLGLRWNIESDTLAVQLKNIREMRSSFEYTKRGLLKLFASIFDPCGYISPYVVTLKIIFQQLWQRKLGWDEPLPADAMKTISLWWKHLHLVDIKLPRFIGSSTYDNEYHIFCDASEKAMCAVVYMKSNEGVFLLLAKSRLAPLKNLSIPRLELTAAVIGSKLKKYLQDTFDARHSQFFLWTDSKVVLCWIQSKPEQWHSYVRNRLSLILEMTDGSQWRHVSGKSNPADLGTRGVSGETLVSCSLWWTGPQFEFDLTKVEESNKEDVDEIIQSERRSKAVVLLINEYQEWFPIFNSFRKTVSVMSQVIQFIRLCRKTEVEETNFEAATTVVIRTSQKKAFALEMKQLLDKKPLSTESKLFQFDPFLDDKNVLRVRGRLQQSSLSFGEKHPIILSSDMILSTLIVKDLHEKSFHGGVCLILSKLREKYWILGARKLIKKVIGSCLVCKKLRGKPFKQESAPLPEERVAVSRAFDKIGLDFAGPLFVRYELGTRKNYILLITCCSSRAVHLELVSSLNTEAFILALKRFIARRGLPSVIYSDNALTFHKADRDLTLLFKAAVGSQAKRYLGENGIRWKFSVPRAPWWGGFWERMVKTVKTCLKVALGKDFVDSERLSTLLCEIESVVNSRPLMSTGVTPEEAITPTHLILGTGTGRLPQAKTKDDNNVLLKFKTLKQALNKYWSRWKKEYLMQLASFHKLKRQDSKPVVVDEIVLVVDEKVPRLQWKLGRIVDVHSGRDGKVRSCTVKLNNGVLVKRAIQLLVPLEVNSEILGGENVENTENMNSSRADNKTRQYSGVRLEEEPKK